MGTLTGENMRMAHIRWMPDPRNAGTVSSRTVRQRIAGRAMRPRRRDSISNKPAAPPTQAATPKYITMTGRCDSSSGVLLLKSSASPRNMAKKFAVSRSGKITKRGDVRLRRRMAKIASSGAKSPRAASRMNGAPIARFDGKVLSFPMRLARNSRRAPG